MEAAAPKPELKYSTPIGTSKTGATARENSFSANKLTMSNEEKHLFH
jgi:hypothetical protein